MLMLVGLTGRIFSIVEFLIMIFFFGGLGNSNTVLIMKIESIMVAGGAIWACPRPRLHEKLRKIGSELTWDWVGSILDLIYWIQTRIWIGWAALLFLFLMTEV